MSQHPNEQPTQSYIDPDEDSGAKPHPDEQATAPYDTAAHPDEQVTAPYDTAAHPDEQATAPYGSAAHPNVQVTVNYGGGQPDEQATERLTDPAENNLTRPLPAGMRTPGPTGPASAIVTAKPYGPPPTPPALPGSKSRLVAGLLGIFVGGLGLHRFYLGYHGIGLALLIGTVFLSILSLGALIWLGPLWGIIEGILYLSSTKGYWSVDARRVPLSD